MNIDRVLGIFGLCRVKKVLNVTEDLHKYYVKCVQNGVETDFKVKPKTGAIYDAGVWWRKNFKICMECCTDGCDIATKPGFKRE